MALDFPELYRVPYDGHFRVHHVSTTFPDDAPEAKKPGKQLEKLVEELDRLQRKFYALDRRALLIVFQAMDAGGKDGTIRAVLSGVNPAGVRVHSFKQPSAEELDHDFLWRTTCRLPEGGHIGVFNRSHYEEVLAVRVHPEFLDPQQLPRRLDRERIWEERFASIRDHEQHLARNGTIILKFWLNVSRAEQKQRFLARLDEPDKNWKFSTSDVEERRHWPAYMEAYEEALAATSRPWAPWYAIPADDKPSMRVAVGETIVKTLRSLELEFPTADPKEIARFDASRKMLEDEEE